MKKLKKHIFTHANNIVIGGDVASFLKELIEEQIEDVTHVVVEDDIILASYFIGQLQPKVVLIDTDIPSPGAVQFVRRIRSQLSKNELYFIALLSSLRFQVEDVYDFDAYLLKTASIREYRETISNGFEQVKSSK